MKQQRIRTRMLQGILAGVTGALLLGITAPQAEARPNRGDRWDKQRDRYENQRDQNEDRWERRDDRRRHRHDRWERRYDRWDKRNKNLKKYRKWESRNSCSCGYCSRNVHPKRWGFWYDQAPRKRFGGEAFYLHGDLGVYFGGFALHIDLGNKAPRGYIYVHPPTGKRFESVRTFRRWCRKYPRQRHILDLMPKDYYRD